MVKVPALKWLKSLLILELLFDLLLLLSQLLCQVHYFAGEIHATVLLELLQIHIALTNTYRNLLQIRVLKIIDDPVLWSFIHTHKQKQTHKKKQTQTNT